MAPGVRSDLQLEKQWGALIKTIEVDVDAKSWRGKPVPKNLSGGAGTQQINILNALFMLGNITMPNILSVGSPAHFWAWLRYYLAPASSSELRIIMPFAELDPHQKGILSDDFGVAISTQWLFDRLGGFNQIVDGRRFVIHFDHLLTKKSASKAKVGSSKIPDFVIEDYHGKWHVLECKGTQSGEGFRDHFLERAFQQKHVLELKGAMRGQRLAAGLAISNESNKKASHLKIIDPPPAPLFSLGEAQRSEAERVARRISIARAIGIVGLSEVAVELSLPQEVDVEKVAIFMTGSERVRSRKSVDDRAGDALGQLNAENLHSFKVQSATYRGRVAEFEFPGDGGEMSGAKVRIRQGVSSDVLGGLKSTGFVDSDAIDQRLEQSAGGVQVETEEGYSSLKYGDVFFSDIKIVRRA